MWNALYSQTGNDMEDLLDIATKIRPLKFNQNLLTTYNLGNASMVRLDNGNYLLSLRQFNYNFMCSFGRLKYKHYKDYIEGRAYYFIELDKDFNFVRRIETDIRPDIL